jgi:hypothetical protein
MSLPAGTYQPAEITWYDAGNEPGTMKFYAKVITAANHDAQQTLFSTLATKAGVLALGAEGKRRYADEVLEDWDQPSNGANRETKLLVQFKDSTSGKRFTTTLPTIDPTIPVYIQNINVKDAIAIDEPTSIVEFIAAFEAFAVPPEAPTHTVTVIGLRVVGRNN